VSEANYVYSGDTYSVKIYSNAYYTVGGATAKKNAGTYSATATLKNSNYVWSDGTSSVKTLSWTIGRLSLALPIVLGKNTYSGYEQTALIPSSAYYTVTGNSATNAGKYTATAEINDTDNCLWADGTTGALTLLWEIDVRRVTKPAAPKNLIGNSLEQTAVIEADSAYTIVGNTGKDAGTYTATVSLADKNNFAWTDGTNSDISYTWHIYTLTFSSDGTENTASSYSFDSPLYTPYRDGYTFEGWYLNSDFSGEKVTSLSEIDTDTVLYAKWTAAETVVLEEKSGINLGKKATIGIIVAGCALVLSGVIIVLGRVFKHGKNKKRGGKNNINRPSDLI
jgi:uncharacterized repeat protein (TIGR02543 family)